MDLILWAHEILSRIPKEYRASAAMVLSCSDYELDCQVHYERPQTDAETDKQARYKDFHKEKNSRVNEITEELKKKYGIGQ